MSFVRSFMPAFRRVAAFVLFMAVVVLSFAAIPASAQLFSPWTYVLKALHLPSKEELGKRIAVYVLNKQFGTSLPVALNAHDEMPKVPNAQLPGGPFHGTPFVLTRANYFADLPPNDYEVTATGWCNRDSLHHAGEGFPYAIGDLEGAKAEAVSTLLFRGTWFGADRNQLLHASWAIQSGLRYAQMPPQDRETIDRLAPDYRDQLKGNIIEQMEDSYRKLPASDLRPAIQEYGKEFVHVTIPLPLIPKISLPLPPLDTVLAGIGPKGHTALDAERLQRRVMNDYTAAEREAEVPVNPAEDTQRIKSPVRPEDGDWSIRVPGRVYMRYVVHGGNMAGNDILQLRILPAPVAEVTSQAHLIEAGYSLQGPVPAVAVASPGAMTGTDIFTLTGGQSTREAILAFLARYGLLDAATIAAERLLPPVALGLAFKAIVGYPQGANAQALDIMVSGWINGNLKPTIPLTVASGHTAATSPTQTLTCSDAVKSQLKADQNRACSVKQSCPGPTHTQKELGSSSNLAYCAVIDEYIKRTNSCIQARQKVVDECYGGVPDETHKTQIEDRQKGLNSCVLFKQDYCQ